MFKSLTVFICLACGLACELEELFKCVQGEGGLMLCAEAMNCTDGRFQKILPDHGIQVLGIRVRQDFTEIFGLFTGCDVAQYHRCFDGLEFRIFDCVNDAGCIGLIDVLHFNGGIDDLEDRNQGVELLDDQNLGKVDDGHRGNGVGFDREEFREDDLENKDQNHQGNGFGFEREEFQDDDLENKDQNHQGNGFDFEREEFRDDDLGNKDHQGDGFGFKREEFGDDDLENKDHQDDDFDFDREKFDDSNLQNKNEDHQDDDFVLDREENENNNLRDEENDWKNGENLLNKKNEMLYQDQDNNSRAEEQDIHNKENQENTSQVKEIQTDDNALNALKTRLKNLANTWYNFQTTENPEEVNTLDKISKELESIEQQMALILKKEQTGGFDVSSSSGSPVVEVAKEEKSNENPKPFSLFGRIDPGSVKLPDIGNFVYGNPYELPFSFENSQMTRENIYSDQNKQQENQPVSNDLDVVTFNHEGKVSQGAEATSTEEDFSKTGSDGLGTVDDQQEKENYENNHNELNSPPIDNHKTQEPIKESQQDFFQGQQFSENTLKREKLEEEQEKSTLEHAKVIEVYTFDYTQIQKETSNLPIQVNYTAFETFQTDARSSPSFAPWSNTELFANPSPAPNLELAENKNQDLPNQSSNTENNKIHPEIKQTDENKKTSGVQIIETSSLFPEPTLSTFSQTPSLSPLKQTEENKETFEAQIIETSSPFPEPTLSTFSQTPSLSPIIQKDDVEDLKTTQNKEISELEDHQLTTENNSKSSEPSEEESEIQSKSTETTEISKNPEETIKNPENPSEQPKVFLQAKDDSENCLKDCERMCEKRQKASCYSECTANICTSSSWWSDYYTVILTGLFLFLVVGVIYLFTQNKSMRILIENGDYGIYSNISN